MYTQISSLLISSKQAVGKSPEPQHGSRHERCAITHQDTSHRCGKCVPPTLILLATANTAPDSRPPTAHSAWSTSDYTKPGSGTSTLYIKKIYMISKETKVLCFSQWFGKPVKRRYINSSTGQTGGGFQMASKSSGAVWPTSMTSEALGVFRALI